MGFVVSQLIWLVSIGILSIALRKSVYGLECYECNGVDNSCDDEHPPVVRKCDEDLLMDFDYSCEMWGLVKNGTKTIHKNRSIRHISDGKKQHCGTYFNEGGNYTICSCDTDKCNQISTDEAVRTWVVEDLGYQAF